MSQYHDESARRYKAKLDAMSEADFAQEGLRHLKFSFFTTLILALILCGSCAYKGEWPGMMIATMMLVALGWLSMLPTWFELRRTIRKEQCAQPQEGDV